MRPSSGGTREGLRASSARADPSYPLRSLLVARTLHAPRAPLRHDQSEQVKTNVGGELTVGGELVVGGELTSVGGER